MYTVKEVAQKLKMNEHTIRYYSDEGLIPMLKRNKNNVRLFDDEAINCLITIRHLRNTGMSLEDIKAYIMLCLDGEQTIKQRHDIIAKQLEIAREQVQEAQLRLNYLEIKVANYQDIITKNSLDYMNLIKKEL